MRTKEELIEEAKELSKKDFLKFVKGIYDVDESAFEHLWRVPIISSLYADSIIETQLSTKEFDEILEILENIIGNELGEYEACFIPFDKLATEFDEQEIKEYNEQLKKGEIKEEYNAFIVYNEAEIEKIYKQFLDKYNKCIDEKEKEKYENNFIKYMATIFTHERCHLNANVLFIERHDNYDFADLVNGAELPLAENYQNGILELKKYNDSIDNNEVLIETLSMMMSNYLEGDSIEDCLKKFVDSRNGESAFDDIDDKMALSVFCLFPTEITDWLVFGAYDDIRENLFDKKLNEIYGSSASGTINPFSKEKFEKYSMKMDLTEKQIQMLKELGIQLKISKSEMAEVANSIVAIQEVDNANKDIEKQKNIQKDKNERE